MDREGVVVESRHWGGCSSHPGTYSKEEEEECPRLQEVVELLLMETEVGVVLPLKMEEEEEEEEEEGEPQTQQI